MYERVGLGKQFNLADGHAHQMQDPVQREIIRGLPTVFADGERTPQADLEASFQETFYRLAHQHRAIRHPRTLLCPSASQSIDLVAAFLGARRMSVGLLQPCFDNLAAMLTRRGVKLTAVSEASLRGERLAQTIAATAVDALFLVLPNNPTGFTLDPAGLQNLAERCAAAGKMLIVDWTFRFFDGQPAWDQYEMLDRSGVSYVCIEDTGKTWPTLELKCSILASSADVYGGLTAPHSDLLLNVSPFVLRLLVEYLADTERRGFERSVYHHIRSNRELLDDALRGSVLLPRRQGRLLSVEWVYVDSEHLSGLDVVRAFGADGIGILPGEHFFWGEPRLGAAYVRVALARDSVMFDSACRRMHDVITRVPGLLGAGQPLSDAR
ncbi:aminotransferase class I/II-fold pyridoxal phosphate-dependent enzyme [Actinoplanes sp. NPDC051411]|uniref:aminotransferase class I/II-fold pyridoxal phosphate-dependent enzyme n=1 Tax=Actinoplanes sp. NPDC051411 TaxID=3155522 RepID=UPI00344777A4